VTVVRTHPAPVRTVIKSGPTISAGGSGTVRAQAGVSLQLTASRPSVSTTRLSSSYGYGPQHGYYVTFSLTVLNTGSKPIHVGPGDFEVKVRGQGTVTSYDGNSPYSGASSQLDNTVLAPGQRVRAPLTFDVKHTHGTLSYAPDGSPALSWRF
jgi:hypothetical protein